MQIGIVERMKCAVFEKLNYQFKNTFRYEKQTFENN